MGQIKAIGFLKQAMGDLVMQTIPLRAFKEKYPDSYFIFGIDEKYKAIEPLFYNHPWINEIHIWKGINNDWPNNEDAEYINNEKFNVVFNAMGLHTRPDWYLHYHYGQEFCFMANLSPPEDISCYLVKWFELIPNCDKIITLSMFPQFDKGQKKSLSIEKLEKLCINIKKLGYQPLQLGGKFEPKLENAERPEFTMLEATKYLCSSKLHITADTSFSWIASAYKHKTLGIYTNNLPFMTDSWSHRPINENAKYMHRNNLEELQIEEIIDAIHNF